jgi:hypothetical protein
MMKRLWIASALLGGLMCLGLSLGVAADDPKADVKEKEEDAAEVKHIAMAYDLALYGRETKSPEMLIAAAKVLRTIKTVPSKDAPKVQGDKGEKEEATAGEAVSLLKVSDGWLKEARDMAKDDAMVNEMADRAGKAKEKSRGSLGGPRSWSGALRTGFTAAWGVNFVVGAPATVSVSGNGVAIFTLSATNENGVVVASSTGRNPSITWVPVMTRPFTVRLHNDAGGLSAYTIYHN